MTIVSGKIVVITGASRGIGAGCAREFAKYGASGLVLHYYGDSETTKEIDSLKVEIESQDGGCRVTTVPGDIADSATATKITKAAVETFGRIDVLVSNAGICPFAEFLTMPHATWERTRQVNLDGSFYIVQGDFGNIVLLRLALTRAFTQAVANQMKSQTPQGGSIIGISSISALVGGGMQCHYTPTSVSSDVAATFRTNTGYSKAGILSLMQSCAVALGQYGIRANAILPGTIATDINKEDLSDAAKREGMVKRTALGRLGGTCNTSKIVALVLTIALAPDDIAGPVVFLASDLAKYVTGSSLLVDGGLFVNLQ
ncbi:hypothetical protein PQX77_003850 [Marasmius sp. AFHP31]|nr:hypothetical protein PQX77_003850 [Marasmius sp. AFHP31]